MILEIHLENYNKEANENSAFWYVQIISGEVDLFNSLLKLNFNFLHDQNLKI